MLLILLVQIISSYTYLIPLLEPSTLLNECLKNFSLRLTKTSVATLHIHRLLTIRYVPSFHSQRPSATFLIDWKYCYLLLWSPFPRLKRISRRLQRLYNAKVVEHIDFFGVWDWKLCPECTKRCDLKFYLYAGHAEEVSPESQAATICEHSVRRSPNSAPQSYYRNILHNTQAIRNDRCVPMAGGCLSDYSVLGERHRDHGEMVTHPAATLFTAWLSRGPSEHMDSATPL